MGALTATTIFGLTAWQAIIILALVILIVLGIVKKAFKLAKLVLILGIVYVALVYFHIL